MKSWIVTYYTFREIIKSKILFNVFFLGLGLFLVCWLAAQFTLGVPQRVALDFGLGTLSLSSIGIALFMGVRLISEEIESRTVYMIVSRPISRAQFLLGKLGGLSLILLVNVFLLSVLTIGMYLFLGGELNSLIFWALWFNYLEALLIMMIVVFFSLFLNATLSILGTLGLLVAGHAINENQLILYAKDNLPIKIVLDFYDVVFPAFYKLNLKDYVLYKQELSLTYLGGSTLYALFYFSIVLIATLLLFNRKNLN